MNGDDDITVNESNLFVWYKLFVNDIDIEIGIGKVKMDTHCQVPSLSSGSYSTPYKTTLDHISECYDCVSLVF
jgi:hypothetical protein